MYVCMLKCTHLCMYTIRYTLYVTVCVMQGLCKHIRMHMQMRIHLCMQIRVYVHINVHVLYKHMYMLHMFTYTNSLHMRTCMRPGERLNREESQGSCTNFLDSEATIATKSTEYDNCPDICHRQMAFRPCFTLTGPFSNTNHIKTSENRAHKKIIVRRKVRITQVRQSKFWCRLWW